MLLVGLVMVGDQAALVRGPSREEPLARLQVLPCVGDRTVGVGITF